MSYKFQRYQPADFLKGFFPGHAFNIFEGQKNDRILSLVFSVVIAALPYLFVFEINRCILVCFFKKYAQHIHIQSFSKTPWACEKRYHRLFIQKIAYHQSFIYIIVAGGCKLKIRYTYWQRFIFREMIHVYGFVRD